MLLYRCGANLDVGSKQDFLPANFLLFWISPQQNHECGLFFSVGLWVSRSRLRPWCQSLQRIPANSTESVGLSVRRAQPMLRAWNVSSTYPPIKQEWAEQVPAPASRPCIARLGRSRLGRSGRSPPSVRGRPVRLLPSSLLEVQNENGI